jgi:hypothetical protein
MDDADQLIHEYVDGFGCLPLNDEQKTSQKISM